MRYINHLLLPIRTLMSVHIVSTFKTVTVTVQEEKMEIQKEGLQTCY